MWVWKDSNGTVRQFAPRTDSPKRCPICGQYFKKGEKGCVIVPPMDVRRSNKRLSQNLIVHYDEWVEFCDGIVDDSVLSEKIAKHKIPKQRVLTSDEEKRKSAFIRACHAYGFLVQFEKPYGVKQQKSGTSIALEYNVFADTIDLSRRGKQGLFDSFYERQIVTNVYNKMHEILGDGKHDDYSCTKTIQGIAEEVNKSVNEMFG